MAYPPSCRRAPQAPEGEPEGGRSRRGGRELPSRVEQVGGGHRLVAVGAGPADADSSAEEVALGAALLIEVAGRALRALVDARRPGQPDEQRRWALWALPMRVGSAGGPMPTDSAKSPSWATPTSSPSASCTRGDSGRSLLVTAWLADTFPFTVVFLRSRQISPNAASGSGRSRRTAVLKFYGLRDNLPSAAPRSEPSRSTFTAAGRRRSALTARTRRSAPIPSTSSSWPDAPSIRCGTPSGSGFARRTPRAPSD